LINYDGHALILAVIEDFHANGKAVYKHQIQKVLYLLSIQGEVNVPFDFVLYRRGPYSFEVDAEIEQMLSYAAITRAASGAYGTTFIPGRNAAFVHEHARAFTPAEQHAIHRICQFAAEQTPLELDRVSAAGWLRAREQLRDDQGIASRLRSLKSHVSNDEANTAAQSLARLLPA